MSVYVDGLMAVKRSQRWPYRQACHLFADTEAELRVFARELGLQPGWIQDADRADRPPHFDLTPAKREAAVKAGACEIDSREVVGLMVRHRERVKQLDAALAAAD